MAQSDVLWFETVKRSDVGIVGGKNSSLGEMVQTLSAKGVRVPPGFATTANAYWRYVDANALRQGITDRLADMNAGKKTLAETGQAIRSAFLHGEWPAVDGRRDNHRLCRALPARRQGRDADVAVRSSATAEDLPDASFAGQQETFLNVRGERALLDACRRCYASLFTDRAISYRQAHGFDHLQVALSIGVQQMVRSDIGGSGVMFSIDTETGFDKVVLIDAAWGLGENVVQGAVDPDAYQVFKPLLADESLLPIVEKTLGEKAIKMVYATGEQPTNERADLQARSGRRFVLNDRRSSAGALGVGDRGALRLPDGHGMGQGRRERRALHRPGAAGDRAVAARGGRPQVVPADRARARLLTTGLSIGGAIVAGRVCLIEDAARHRQVRRRGDPGHRTSTDPDWVPIMKQAAAIVTDHGGRTSHAAIVSRELGLPARGRHRQRHPRPPRPTRKSPFPAPRAMRASSMRARRSSRSRNSIVGDLPKTKHAGDAQPRQSRRGVQLVAAPGRRRRPRPHGVRHHQSGARPPDGAGALRYAEGRGGEGRRSPRSRPATTTRPSTSSTRWRAAWRGSRRRSIRSR